MSNEIVQYSSGSDAFMPIMSIETAISRYNSVVGFVKKLMVEGTDFGKIPGTGDKPVLLKPGAEKLSTLFGLAPVFMASEVVEDWTGKNYEGEPMFYYRYKCELYRGGVLIATSEGSCNSRESKYRYRKAERTCPECGAASIIKGKQEYGGGYVCFAKKGGCGAKFRDGDPVIESQEVGRVANPDIADQVNTIQKMAQKRALVAAVLLAVNASEFFTQDIEDLVEATYTIVADEPTQERTPQPTTTQQPPAEAQHRQARKPATTQQSQQQIVDNAAGKFHKQVTSAFGGLNVDDARHWYITEWTTNATPDKVRSSTSDMADDELMEMIADIKANTVTIRKRFQAKQQPAAA